MDRIEPVRPSPPTIAPIDATRVQLLGREREAALARQRERERRRRQEEEQAQASQFAEQAQASQLPEQDGDDEQDDRPHIDLRV